MYLMGPERRLHPRPGGRLAPAGRRRDRAAGDQRRAGSVARQRNRPGLHRGRRARGRNPADRPEASDQLGLSRRPGRSGWRGPSRRPRAAGRGGQHRPVAARAGARLRPRRSAGRHAQPAALHPQRARRGREVGVVDLGLLAARPHRRDVPAVEEGTRRGRGRDSVSGLVSPPPAGMLIAWHSATIRTRSISRAWPESCRRCRWSSRSWKPRPRRRCRRRCGPTSPGGAGDERTQRANCEAFEQWGLIPRMFVGAAQARSVRRACSG